MQQQDVVGPAVREHVFDLRLDDMRWLVAHHLHGEVADLRVTEHLAERLRVRRRGQQVAQRLLLVGVVGDDQGFPLAGHCPPPLRSDC
jgi:hypothetical protein